MHRPEHNLWMPSMVQSHARCICAVEFRMLWLRRLSLECDRYCAAEQQRRIDCARLVQLCPGTVSVSGLQWHWNQLHMCVILYLHAWSVADVESPVLRLRCSDLSAETIAARGFRLRYNVQHRNKHHYFYLDIHHHLHYFDHHNHHPDLAGSGLVPVRAGG